LYTVLEALTVLGITVMISTLANPGTASPSDQFLFRTLQSAGSVLDYRVILLIISFSVTGLIIIKNVCAGFIRYFTGVFASATRGEIGIRLHEKFFSSPYATITSLSCSSFQQKFEWRYKVGDFIEFFLLIICDLFLLTFVFLVLVMTRPLITLGIFIILTAISLFVTHLMKIRQYRKAVLIRNLNHDTFLQANTVFRAIKEVKAKNLEHSFLNTIKNLLFSVVPHVGLQRVLISIPSFVLESAGFILISLVIFLLLFPLDNSLPNTFMTISLIAVAAWKMLPSLNRVLSNNAKLNSLLPFIDEIISTISDLSSTDGVDYGEYRVSSTRKDTGLTINSVRLANVSFTYPDRIYPAISGIDAIIEKGTNLGIIGPSGAGKTTVLDVWLGLLAPQEGQVYINERVANERDWEYFRSNIGYVPQSPYIMNGTVAENIIFNRVSSRSDDNEVMKSCRKAAMDFIDELPKGIHTIIGENGVNLSGGQKQRIAIARALYNHPSFLFLDEATNELNHAVEREILSTIDKLRNELTLIIISHSIQPVRLCDFLVWIQDGKIVMGDHPKKVLSIYDETQLTGV